MSGPVRILLVDDRPENLLSLAATLASSDYELIKVGSGEDALRYLLVDDCAIILLDVQMPNMDGFETADLIKADPTRKDIPIIFLTALNGDPRYVARGYRAGAVDYISKPIVPEILQAKVAVFAQLHRSRQLLIEQGRQIQEHQRREQQRALADIEVKALRREQALGRRYRELVDGLRNAIVWVAEPDSLVMSFVSASTDDLLGWTPDRDDAGALLELVHPADRAAFEGQLRVLGLDKPVTFEHRLNARDGETWARTSVRLERKLDTEGHEVRGFTVDISDAKDLERTLRLTAHASEELGKSLDVNDIAERLALACVPELADGCMVTIEQAARRDDDGPPAIARASAWASGRMREHSERVDPVTLPIDVAGRAVGTASLWRLGSEPDEGALLVARDLTRRAAQAIENAELYQKTLDAIAHRDEFLSVASHELRTPLLPLKLNIQSCVAALKAGDVSLPSFAKKLELADRQVDRLENLVSSLLDVARIRTGKLELDRDKTDLAALVTEVVARFRPELARKGVELTCDAQPVWGTWDKSRLDQVVSNLVSNAIKYGNGKPIDIHVRSAPSKAVLIVADHGIGLAADDRERIFARFERAVSANNYGGLGLGLYIARQIVRAHGGNIHVESAPGQGCQFIVELPVEHLLATPAGASATAS